MTSPLSLRAFVALAVVVLAAPAAWGQALAPNNCTANSVLPTTYQFHQDSNRWMGVAMSPQNPAVSVHLEMLAGPAAPYEPAVVSDHANGTSFAVRNFAGQPDGWCYATAFSPLATNAAYVAQWDPGSGALLPGGTFSATYGGLALGCELLRVFDVYLAAGRSYAFTLTTSEPADDVKLALVGAGTRADGWATRADALFEQPADPEGAAAAHVFTAPASGNYALVVFVDDLTAFGGVYTVGFDAWTPPADLPDLVVARIEPATATAGTHVVAHVWVRNDGGGDAPASTTHVRYDYGALVAGGTAALAAGDSTIVSIDLGIVTAGSHEVWANADGPGTIAEALETNNALTRTLTVTGAVPAPDLVVTSVSPAAAVPNQPFSVYANLQNRGTADAAATTTRLEVIPGWAYLDLATPAIPAGTVFKVQGVMAGVPAGEHTLRAVADWTAQVAELDELNNVLAGPLAAVGPDLVVESITPTDVVGNVAPIYTVTVRNQGDGDAAPSSTRLLLDGASECAAVPTPGVPAGGAVAVACTSSTFLAPGAHEVTAIADATSAVPESDETNNQLAVTVTATATSVLVRADGTGTYPTIQAAVDAVAPGGEVLLAAGTYTGAGNRDVTFRGKDVAVIALPGGVVIDCQGDPENAHRAFVFNSGESPAALVRGVTITGGWTESGAGGGLSIFGSAPTIEDCVIHGCHAFEGGAVAFGGSPAGGLRPQLTRCTLTGNSALGVGGAVVLNDAIGVMMDNVLIASNYGYGGAVGYGPSYSGTLDLDCCDLWGNGGGDYTGPAAGQLGVDFNISQDPLFCDAAADDFHVAANSPCAEAMNGDCGRIGALAAACGPKGGTVRRVQADGSGPYLTIQHAINSAVDGDVVELGDGVYTGTGNRDVTTLGKAILVRSASGDRYACRLDAQNAHRGFVFNSGEGPTTVLTGIGIFNGAAATGAGILCSGASPTLDDLYIGDCNATDDGGGLHLESYASPIVSDCLFENNTAADDGGGLYAATWCSPDIDGCTFLGNLAGDRGAGATFAVNCFPTLDGCTFRGNEGANGGGLTFVYAYGPVTDCVFMDNSGTWGGAFQGYGNARVDFVRCTFNGNRAANGSGVYLRNASAPTFTNCIVAFGVDGAAFARYAADCTATLACCDVWGNAGGDWTAMIADQNGTNGNLWADPLFCDRYGDELTLRGDSPCALVNNGACGQIGALPVGCSGSWLVRPDGTGDFATIQAAIDAAVAGETVVLADGTYTGPGNRDLDFKGKAITVRSQSGDAAACVVDCGGTPAAPHFGVNFVTGETAASVLQDVTITGAYRFNGAGGRIDGASPTLRGVVFRGNAGDSGGGLILANGAAPLLEDCVFADNTAANAGGGMYANAAHPQLLRCRFEGNTAHWGGGGLYCQYASPAAIECVFAGNASDFWGGGAHTRYAQSAPTFTDCLFTGNAAPQGGAVYGRDGSYPSFMTCTFSGNGSADGAVLHGRGGTTMNVVRGLLVFSPTGAAVTGDGTAVFNLLGSDVYGNAGGDWTGPIAAQVAASDNFAADPVFCDPWSGDFTLASVSPCLPSRSPCGLRVGAFGEGCALADATGPAALVPAALVLDPNVPNPFNPMTTVVFATPREGRVEVVVYGLDGRRIAILHDGPLPAGRHELTWGARDDRGRAVASGVYLVRVRAGAEVRVRKMTLMR